jgi:hypothetical protein
MEGIAASALAVAGTLLGAVMVHVFQERSRTRQDRRAREERIERLLLQGCAEFISLAEDYRRAQYDRWVWWREDPESERTIAARAEAYRLKGEVRGAYYRLRLMSPVPDQEGLAELAEKVLSLTQRLPFTPDRQELHQRGEAAREACEAFIVCARAVLHHTEPPLPDEDPDANG